MRHFSPPASHTTLSVCYSQGQIRTYIEADVLYLREVFSGRIDYAYLLESFYLLVSSR